MVGALEIPVNEFASRRARAIEMARDRGLAGLVVWSRGGTNVDFFGDVQYLTNYVSPLCQIPQTTKWSGRGHSALVLPVDEDPVLVVEMPDYFKEQIAIDDVRFTVQVPLTVGEILREKGLDRGRLGLVGRETLLFSSYRLMSESLSAHVDFEPADEILERLKMIKSQNEIALIRKAANIGADWLRTTMEAVTPGRTEAQIVGDGLRFLTSNGGFLYDVAVGSGPDCFQYFGQRNGVPFWERDRPTQPGDIVHIDTWGPTFRGYYTDIARSTVAGGGGTGAQKELFEASRELIHHIIDGIRPGVIVGELYERGAAWLADHGFGAHVATNEESGTYFGNLFPCFGHGIGLGVEHPWIVEEEPTVLQPNMALAVEFFMDRPGVGAAKYERNLLVTAEGHELLDTQCPERWWD